MKKTLMDKIRSMLTGVGLTQEFWVEAIDITKYLLNCWTTEGGGESVVTVLKQLCPF
jgi:hypothetical protein